VAKKLTIKAARVSAGYTQATMAEAIGLTREYINTLENGRAPFTKTILLAWSKVTGFDVDDFILPTESTKRGEEEEE
jgi:transcriptional regulator with XRE-family HTH domain